MAGGVPRRFFSRLPVTGEEVTLETQEAHHAIHVVRLQPADEVTLFDGSGSEFDARVVSVGRSTLSLAITARRQKNREASRRVVLAVPLPKGDRQRFLVEKCVEVGVCRFIPLQTSRSVTKLNSTNLDRLRRAVIEASKQCGRNELMAIDPPRSLPELLLEKPATDGVLADPAGDLSLNEWQDHGQSLCLAIGPEGGFDREELQMARQNDWQIVNLGPRTLRVETAATCLAAYAIWSQPPS